MSSLPLIDFVSIDKSFFLSSTIDRDFVYFLDADLAKVEGDIDSHVCDPFDDYSLLERSCSSLYKHILDKRAQVISSFALFHCILLLLHMPPS